MKKIFVTIILIFVGFALVAQDKQFRNVIATQNVKADSMLTLGQDTLRKTTKINTNDDTLATKKYVDNRVANIDSLINYVPLKDSTIKYVTPTQLDDSISKLSKIDTSAVRNIALDVLRDTIPDIDSAAYQYQIRALEDSLKYYPKSPKMIYKTIPINSTNISVFYGFTMASPHYSLNVKAWYEIVKDGKTIRVNNGIYDLDSTSSGFTCKVRVPSGYLDYEAKDTLGILTYESGWSESDPIYSIDSSTLKEGVQSWNESLAKIGDKTNVRYWGAVGDGITNDSAAFKMAFDSCQNIYVPKGSYIVGNLLVKYNNFSIRGDGESSILKFRTGATGTMIDCDSFQVDVSNLQLQGGTNTDYRYSGYSGKDRNGIALKSSRNSRLTKLTIQGFENRGIWLDDKVTAAPIIERLSVQEVWLMYNYIGLETGLNGEQHALYSKVYCVMNRFGIIGGEGNLNFSLCTLDKNYYGLYLDGTRANDGHGNMIGSLFNHNIYPVWARQLANGFTFIGNQIHQGTFIIDTCSNVDVNGGRIDLTTWSLHGTGLNQIRNNICGTNYGNTISKSVGCSTTFYNNVNSSGTYLENRTLPPIKLYGSGTLISVYDTISPVTEIFKLNRTWAVYKVPYVGYSTGSNTIPWRIYSKRNTSYYLAFINQTSTDDCSLSLRDSTNSTKVSFNTRSQSYINTSAGFIVGGTSTSYCFAVAANGNSTGVAYFKNDVNATADSIVYVTKTGGITASGIIQGASFNVSSLNTEPASSTATGTTGEIRFTATGIYICIATNSWIKCTGSTW